MNNRENARERERETHTYTQHCAHTPTHPPAHTPTPPYTCGASVRYAYLHLICFVINDL
jgi:hypothetical protein